MGKYRQTYGLRRVPVVTNHILLSTSIIHLLDLHNPSSTQNLALSITCLREMTANHAFATRCLHIVRALSQQWNIHLPSEIAQVAYDLPPEVPKSLPDPHGYGLPSAPQSSLPDRFQQPANNLTQDSAMRYPFAAVEHSHGLFATSADMFWSPFSDCGVPLQAHQWNGPMDISAMLDVPNKGRDQLGRDGFRMAQLEDPILSPTYSQVDST